MTAGETKLIFPGLARFYASWRRAMRVAARHEVTSRWPHCSLWHELTSFWPALTIFAPWILPQTNDFGCRWKTRRMQS